MMSKFFGLPLLILIFITCAAPATPAQTVQFDDSGGQIIATEIVPNGKSPQGEVRLVLRDDVIVLQTILYSKILKKVLSAIQRKENIFWAEAKVGSADSQKYIETLFQSFNEIWISFKQREKREERRQGMLIEFTLSEKTTQVEIFAPTLTGEPGTLEILDRHLLNHLEVSRIYAIGSLLEISRDSLNLSADDLINGLEIVQPATSWLRSEWIRSQKKG